MSDVITLKQVPHREAEYIKEKARHVESLLILCENSIRFHAIPEMQNVADVLESLFQPIWEIGNEAEALEKVLYQDFESNGGKPSFACEIEKVGGAS